MNTAKQINIIIGLLMVFLLSTLLYFLWDNARADDATDRQLMNNAERGGKLFSVNCRACHGLTGKGALENSTLPGAPLNIDANRPTDVGKLAALQSRLTDTIHCGRVGTRMPPWSTAENGPLNDFQIEQLVTLITSSASEAGWKNAQDLANHADEFAPAKHLVDDINASTTSFKLDDAHGPKTKDLLRIDDDPKDDTYEIVEVVDAPAISTLADDISAGATQFDLAVAFLFKDGDQVSIEDEHLKITDAPSVTTLKADVIATDTNIQVDSATGLKKDDVISLESEKLAIVSVTGNTLRVTRGASETEAKDHKAGATMIEASNTITVQRGTDGTTAKSHRAKTSVQEAGDTIEVKRAAFATTAAEHKTGTEVFLGPILPADTITGASGTPPCGQKSAAPAATPGPAVPVSGSVAVTLGDNFFKISDQQNPPLQATAGQPVTFNITNGGTGVHDLHISAADGTFTGNPCETGGTDPCSDPSAIPGGQTATLSATLAAGTYNYRCDFHPTEMKGEITVQ